MIFLVPEEFFGIILISPLLLFFVLIVDNVESFLWTNMHSFNFFTLCKLLLLNTFQILLLFNIDFAYCYKIELYIDPVVHDYRRCSSRKGDSVSAESSPTVSKLCLKMSLENIVKDIPRLLTSLRHMVI